MNAGQSCHHTPCPTGYVAWHEWAEKMSKTHHQERCSNCGLWAIWTKNDAVIEHDARDDDPPSHFMRGEDGYARQMAWQAGERG